MTSRGCELTKVLLVTRIWLYSNAVIMYDQFSFHIFKIVRTNVNDDEVYHLWLYRVYRCIIWWLVSATNISSLNRDTISDISHNSNVKSLFPRPSSGVSHRNRVALRGTIYYNKHPVIPLEQCQMA